MAKNILELTTLIDHATVAIDGVAHDLINPEELSIVDNHRVGKWGGRVQELYKDLDGRSEEEVAELASLLDRLCRLLLRAPAEVHARLTDSQRLSVAMVFIGLQRGTLPVPEGASQEPGKQNAGVLLETSTGENS